jgi:hypothetical protein
METNMRSLTEDEIKLIGLARYMGVIEAIEVVAGALHEKRAMNPETTDDELDTLRAIEKESFKRRRASWAAAD